MIVKQVIRYEVLTRLKPVLILNTATNKYELSDEVSGTNVQHVSVIFDDETGEIIETPRTTKVLPVEESAGEKTLEDGTILPVFALDDIFSKVHQTALRTANEKVREFNIERAEKDKALKQVSELKKEIGATKVAMQKKIDIVNSILENKQLVDEPNLDVQL